MMEFIFRHWSIVVSATATCAPMKPIQVTKPREQEASGDKLVTQSGVLYETKKVRLLTVSSSVCLLLRHAYRGVAEHRPWPTGIPLNESGCVLTAASSSTTITCCEGRSLYMPVAVSGKTGLLAAVSF